VNQARKAYTLLELVLVMALLVMLTALAYPSLEGMLADFRVSQATDMVRTAWARARAQAMNEGRPYRFSVLQNKGNYRLAPDTPDYWSGNDPQPSDPSNPPLILEGALPKGVRFATDGSGSADSGPGGDSSLPAGSVDSSQWVTTATFLPDGSALDDVSIAFAGRTVKPVTLKLRSLTGAATVQSGQMNSGQ